MMISLWAGLYAGPFERYSNQLTDRSSQLPHQRTPVTARRTLVTAGAHEGWLRAGGQRALPFGFLAVRRHTRLVLAAGWVTDPEPYREDEDEEVCR
ncbi:hypothetical protein GCM10010349_12520 [Streptomyces flavofungini]|nr:hypothetical protein GCM10010349_12520 [Streptomyces flavofungini]